MDLRKEDRAFIHAHAGTLFHSERHKIMFGYYPEDHSRQTYEMAFTWHELGGTLGLRLEIYDESWQAFAATPELVVLMDEIGASLISSQGVTSHMSPTPQRVAERLKAIGFKQR